MPVKSDKSVVLIDGLEGISTGFGVVTWTGFNVDTTGLLSGEEVVEIMGKEVGFLSSNR